MQGRSDNYRRFLLKFSHLYGHAGKIAMKKGRPEREGKLSEH